MWLVILLIVFYRLLCCISGNEIRSIEKEGYPLSFEDKDFIIRQIKQLAEGIGQFLSLQSVKELIHYDNAEKGLVSDEEIEAILLMHNIRKVQQDQNLTDKVISGKLEISQSDLTELENGEKVPASNELVSLRKFVNSF